MKTVLVTGGCGFIGSQFVRLVLSDEPDWRIVNLDKLTYSSDPDGLVDLDGASGFRFVHGDVADDALVDQVFDEEKPWAVINFAGESHVDRSILDPFQFVHTNVLGVNVLLEAARRHGIARFVQISTDEVYGDAQDQEPFSEESPLRPSSPYAASKASADLFCLAHSRTFGTPVLITRSSNNYGAYQFPEKFIPLLILNALQREELPIYGDGLQIRDWLYVEDNCKAILRILKDGQVGSVYNVGTGEVRTNIEVARAVCRMVSAESGLDIDELNGLLRFTPDRPGHDKKYMMVTHKLRNELKWMPETLFESGLKKTVRWYLDNTEWLHKAASGEYGAYYDAVYRRKWRSG